MPDGQIVHPDESEALSTAASISVRRSGDEEDKVFVWTTENRAVYGVRLTPETTRNLARDLLAYAREVEEDAG